MASSAMALARSLPGVLALPSREPPGGGEARQAEPEQDQGRRAGSRDDRDREPADDRGVAGETCTAAGDIVERQLTQTDRLISAVDEGGVPGTVVATAGNETGGDAGSRLGDVGGA